MAVDPTPDRMATREEVLVLVKRYVPYPESRRIEVAIEAWHVRRKRLERELKEAMRS